MAITPIDIQQHQFKSRPFGYEKYGVDEFLEQVATEMERILRLNQELREELARTRAALDEMKKREATLKETLVTTQKISADIKANAHKEAEIVIGDAQIKAERVVRDAEDRRIQLINEIQEIKRQKISFETSLRALVMSHIKLLDLEVVEVEGGHSNAEDHLLEDSLPFDEITASELNGVEFDLDDNGFDPEDL
ncbi:MAG: cell division protein DivIVA [Desulfuromonas sp.]|nr:MAG: cell division protein DivIVA [Desulfuromonas sp.]